MGRYLLRRLAIAVPSLVGISIVLFAVLALAPGDAPAQARVNNNILNATDGVLFCSGYPWIDIKCYGAVGDDTNDDTTAINDAFSDALTIYSGTPIHFPHGTYKISAKLTWDYAEVSGVGLQVISDDAVIDGLSIPSGNVLQINCSGGTPETPARCLYLSIKGTLQVWGNTPAYVVDIGNTDFSDQHLGAYIQHLAVLNYSVDAAAGGARINFVGPAADLWIYGDNDGGSARVAGLAVEKLHDSKLSGLGYAQGANAPALLFENSDSTGNLISGFNFVAATCLSITSPTTTRNTFISPVFTDCTTAIGPPGLNGNILIAPTLPQP